MGPLVGCLAELDDLIDPERKYPFGIAYHGRRRMGIIIR
jgi:hypothetical protein